MLFCVVMAVTAFSANVYACGEYGGGNNGGMAQPKLVYDGYAYANGVFVTSWHIDWGSLKNGYATVNAGKGKSITVKYSWQTTTPFTWTVPDRYDGKKLTLYADVCAGYGHDSSDYGCHHRDDGYYWHHDYCWNKCWRLSACSGVLTKTSALLYVTGVVTQGGSPIVNDLMTASQSGAVVTSTNTDGNGAYSLALPAGSYTISETLFGYTQDVQLNVNTTLDFRLR